MKYHNLSFDIVQEVWNEYDLHEEKAFLKARVILTKMFNEEFEENKFRMGGDNNTIVTLIPKPDFNQYGKPDPVPPSPEKIKKATKIDIPFTTKREEWNIYTLSNGVKIKIKLLIASIKRCNGLYDKDGLPVYATDSSVVVHTDPTPK